jgi:hypothetical protein
MTTVTYTTHPKIRAAVDTYALAPEKSFCIAARIVQTDLYLESKILDRIEKTGVTNPIDIGDFLGRELCEKMQDQTKLVYLSEGTFTGYNLFLSSRSCYLSWPNSGRWIDYS